MHIHLIGIGGIGLSALAQYYLSEGCNVVGTDLSDSEIVTLLKKKGAKILVGKHKSTNLSLKTDLVVYSPAVADDNPELKKAEKLGMEIKTYPQALGDLTRKYFTIAVSGTHGKSTTSAMLSLVMIKAGLDPTVIIGTKLKEFNNSNFRKGKSKYLVIEADEYKKSFLNYNPDIIILTNIEEDHLDYYKNLKSIMDSFGKFLGRIADDGYLVVNDDDDNVTKILKAQKSKLHIKKYSLKKQEAREIEKILKIPGKHNVSNALAALRCAQILKIDDSKILEALSQFKGSWRRFDIFKLKNITLISDYAHHPTEIEKTLEAAREKYPNKKIRCVFQPHQYQRTFYLFEEFVRVFKKAPVDELILCEIYDVAGRETKDMKNRISSQKIEEAVNEDFLKYRKNLKEAEEYILKTIEKEEILIIMGAGDIYNLFLKLKVGIDKNH